MLEDRKRNPQFSFGIDPDEESPKPAAKSRRGIILAVAIVGLLIAGGAYLYVYQRELLRQALDKTPLALPASVTRAYKWKDADGAWNLTESPPPEGVEYEEITVNSDQNILPALQTN